MIYVKGEREKAMCKFHISSHYANGGQLTYLKDGKSFIEAPSLKEAMKVFKAYERAWRTDGTDWKDPAAPLFALVIKETDSKGFTSAKALDWATKKVTGKAP